MNIITKLNIRQKVMLALTVLAAVFLAWQIYNFVHGNTAPAKILPVSGAPIAPSPAGVAQIPVAKQLPVSNGSTNLALAEHQQQYLNLVREYQITKMKRQVMEEEASLANAQKRIADAGKNGAYIGTDTFAGSMPYTSGGYQLAYLDRQAGQWTATLAQGNQYKEVHIGTRLADGSRVLTINAKGVILQPTHGKNLVLGFQGSVNVDNDSVSAATVKAHSSPSKKTQPVANNLTATVANPNNAKIAKILGITAVPVTAAPAPTVKSTTDIPAAPLANAPPKAESSAPAAATTEAAPATALSPQPTAPAATPDAAQPENAAPPADSATATDAPSSPQTQASDPTAPVVKPVSVKALREHNAEEAAKMPQQVALSSGEISWKQAADLTAAAAKAR